MSIQTWEEPAELIQAALGGRGWGGGRAPSRLMAGSLGEIARFLRGQDQEEIWRFTVVTESGRHIRSAELRDLVRSIDGKD